MSVSIEEIKKQRRWVLWNLEEVNGKPTKVPYQSNGHKALTNAPNTWSTYAELEGHLSNFSGVGLLLGEIDGCSVFGVDFDKCCDAVSGKFSPETRDVIIGLDTYSEFSPSGTGAHILGLGHIPPNERGKEAHVKPFPGCKQIEIKGKGFYFTFTARHLNKTPLQLEDRQEQLTALCARVAKITKPHDTKLTVTAPVGEEDRFKKLWAGDMSDYGDNHSSADFALCLILARRLQCNAFKIDEQFRESGLYRDKWERDDYRENTITNAIRAVMKDSASVYVGPEDEETLEDDGETEFLVEGIAGPEYDGWFPKGELSLIGAPSGAGKTSWAMPLLEKIRNGEEVWGHKIAKARDYRVLLHDRSKKAMRRTAKALHMSTEAMERIIRLKPEQQSQKPADVLQAHIETNPGVEVWFIEGLDLWIPDMNKMNVVAPIVDSLQRIATRRNVAIIATVGAPKQKGKDRYFGRDALFGSSALARKVETVVLMGLHDEEDPNSVRRCWILPRAGRAEVMYFAWTAEGLTLTDKPDDQDEGGAFMRNTVKIQAEFKTGEPIVWRSTLGFSEKTFRRWRDEAVKRRIVYRNDNQFLLSQTGVKSGPN